MKSRRLSSVIHILIVASVFLFTSCGIPTFLVPKVSIQSVSGAGSVNFNLKYESENSGHANAENIGLALFYYVESGSASGSQTSYIKTWFGKNARTTERDGIVISPSYGKAIANLAGTNDQNFDLYVFDRASSAVDAPFYNDQLSDTSGPINYEFQLSYVDSNKVGVEVYENSVLIDSFVLNMSSAINLEENDSICIYAAVSVQSNNYSNLYWSDLSYVGAIRIE